MKNLSNANALKAFVNTIVILFVYFIIQLSVISFMGEHEAARTGFDPFHDSATGFMLSLAITVSVPACLALILIFMNSNSGLGISERLRILLPGRIPLVLWLCVSLLFGLAYVTLSYCLDRPLVNDFMTYTYETIYWLPLFTLSASLLGPLFEEILFREFLFRPISDSGAGAAGAIAITSIAWACIHVQYGIFDIVYIFLLGLILGIARQMTGSFTTAFLMHATNNLLSIIFTHVYLGQH